ncbi:HdeD family acid-resistance protein [Microbacterium sp. G2-8]|uniref:HdeD family acid-resistance protein n=1 Tax=Microbacterium sp. G2-8 TaxID=2842454 RepID=UPI0021A985DB|nr:DUF308 domain-containing protein [Microbacterium sp. G2-8]
MSYELRPDYGMRQALRTAILIGSIVSLVFGLLILIWPAKSAMAVTVLLAIYAVIGGLFQLAYGIFARGTSGWMRTGIIVLGLVFLAGGIAAFANLSGTTTVIAVIVTTLIGIAWILDGIVSLTSLRRPSQPSWPGAEKPHRGWTIAFAIITIVAGVLVVLSPLATAVGLWILIGASLVLFGVIGIIRAATLEK